MATTKQALEVKEKMYDFIVRFSQKHLRFPSPDEMGARFKFSTSRLYDRIGELVADRRLYKVGKFGFGITAYAPKGTKIKKVK